MDDREDSLRTDPDGLLLREQSSLRYALYEKNVAVIANAQATKLCPKCNQRLLNVGLRHFHCELCDEKVDLRGVRAMSKPLAIAELKQAEATWLRFLNLTKWELVYRESDVQATWNSARDKLLAIRAELAEVKNTQRSYVILESV